MKELNLSEKTALAGYYLVGDIDAAYKLINQNSDATDEMFHRMAKRWVRQNKCAKYIQDLSAIQTGRAEKELSKKDKYGIDKNNDLTDKNVLLRELQIQYRAAGTAKEKSDILVKIADIQQMKKTMELSEKEERVHYYLPLLECEHCPHKAIMEEKNNSPI